MLNNCTVCKFNGVYPDNILPSLTSVILHRKYNSGGMSGTNAALRFISETENLNFKISGTTQGVGCFCPNSSSTSTDTGITEANTTAGTSSSLYVSNGTYDLKITPKLGSFVEIFARWFEFRDNLQSLVTWASPNLSVIHITNSTIEGDLNKLAGFASLATLRINGTQIYGNIESLGECISLTDCHFQGCDILGSMRNFANLLKSNGKKSSALVYVPSSFMTDLVGTKSGDTYTLTFDENGNWE